MRDLVYAFFSVGIPLLYILLAAYLIWLASKAAVALQQIGVAILKLAQAVQHLEATLVSTKKTDEH
jgi:hypothetical protein